MAEIKTIDGGQKDTNIKKGKSPKATAQYVK